MKIGILSDTHGVVDDIIVKFMESVDQIWHAGDFGGIETADELAALKPLIGVFGNCDDSIVRLTYPLYKNFVCEGKKILMMHIGGYPGRYDPRALRLIEEIRPDIFVCGHSHILKVVYDKHREMLCINPGAAGVFGIHRVRTMLRLNITNGGFGNLEVGEYPR